MSTPSNDTQTQPVTFAEQVNAAVGQMTQDADGKWTLPESVDANNEALVFAVNAERRRRDTQSAFTRTAQENAQLKAEAEQLAAGWKKDFVNSLPVETQAELEELKITDPDKWRVKLQELEQQRGAQFQENLSAIKTKAVGESEKDYRQRAFTEFTEANPDLKLTDDVIKYDIPPRITMQLDKGEITFGEYLTKAAEYLRKGRVMPPKEGEPGDINLSRAPGDSHPSQEAEQRANKASYGDEIY